MKGPEDRGVDEARVMLPSNGIAGLVKRSSIMNKSVDFDASCGKHVREKTDQ